MARALLVIGAILPGCFIALAAALITPARGGGAPAPGQAAESSLRVSPPAPSVAPGSLSIIFTGEADGYLAPCGCSSPMIGGFARRGSWLAEVEKLSPTIRVENGDLTEALGRQDELKAEALVDMLSVLKYDALNLGDKDFRLGLPYMLSLQSRFKGAFLCANARGPDGSPLFKESTVISRAAAGKPLRILIAGVLSDQYGPQIAAANPDVTIESPAAALDRLRPQAAGADVRVLLFHGPRAEAEEIARDYPTYQLIVCAHEGDHPMDSVKVGRTSIVCSGQDGKYVGRAALSASGQVGDVTCPALGPDLADDPAITQLKAAYLERVAGEDLLGKAPRSPTLNGDSFAGSEACASCHAEPYRIWKTSGHAHALETLARVMEDRDPECVTCHVVGLNRVSGFSTREKTPGLASVGCESCHGAAARHVKDPKSALPRVDSSVCLGCHNPLNSPRFDYAAYWPRIRH